MTALIKRTALRFAPAIVALAGALALGGCSVFGGPAAPEPEYSVVLSDPPYEIRDYPALVLVKTPVGGDDNAAFRRLFAYISGRNGGAREIAMTAPVLQSEGERTEIAMTAPVLMSGADDSGEMAFILTDDFTLETAPVPADPAVTLGTLPARRVAVITFNGWALDRTVAKHRRMLQDWVDARSLTAISPPETAQYNPPWTLPTFRRNEVQIPIAPPG